MLGSTDDPPLPTFSSSSWILSAIALDRDILVHGLIGRYRITYIKSLRNEAHRFLLSCAHPKPKEIKLKGTLALRLIPLSLKLKS